MNRTGVVLAVIALSWVAGAWLVARVWKTDDPKLLKLLLTVVAAVPVIGPLVVYWQANFPSRLHPQSRATFPKQINSCGRWKTEADESQDKGPR
jgi:hypothetical protein